MDELQQLIIEEGINIKVFIGKETIDDPNYKNKSISYLNPRPIRCLCSQVGYTSSRWRMPGINASSVMELTMNKRHKNLIEKSRKMIIDGTTYYGWRPSEGNKIQYKIIGDYLYLLVHTDETA